MKRAYIIRHGAYGDHIHMSHIPKILTQEGYEVTFQYNLKGVQIHSFNPYIKHHVFREPTAEELSGDPILNYQLYKHYKKIKKEYDLFINFDRSLEGTLITDEKTHEYFMPKHWRNKKYGNTCFYDQSVLWAKLPKKYLGRTGDLYFRDKEHECIERIFEPIRNKGKKILIWSIAGTMWQKAIYPWSQKVCEEFQKRHPEVIVFVTAGPEYSEHAWGVLFSKGMDCSQVPAVNVISQWPFRQALLATKYADMLITPETGLGIGAGVYETPKIMLLTAASIKNIVGNDKNDFSMQSEAWCSPCHRAIYNMDVCDTIPISEEASCSIFNAGKTNKLPICVFFDQNKVLNQMEKMYECSKKRKIQKYEPMVTV